PWRGGGSAPLATAVSLPTAREARPGAQRRDTPAPGRAVNCSGTGFSRSVSYHTMQTPMPIPNRMRVTGARAGAR
ncbi:MAG TPA: hypothetical protein VEX86_27150, partial [Longimicrobium sp.]|nr:hypothetical protein [Longimicrobium sp.]